LLALVGRETFKSGKRIVSDKRILQHITASSCMRGLNLSFRACQRDYGRGRRREREGEGGRGRGREREGKGGRGREKEGEIGWEGKRGKGVCVYV